MYTIFKYSFTHLLREPSSFLIDFYYLSPNVLKVGFLYVKRNSKNILFL